jgi:hypothetical protein
MENQNIAELIARVTTGDPWHGSNVEQLLAGVSAADAARRPSPEVHSLWELVLHMTGWAREVRQRLGGRAAQDPEEGDWPQVAQVSEERWAAAKKALFDAHRDLESAVAGLDPAALAEPVVDFRDRPLGTGLSKYLTLHGLVHHTVYHSGQLAIVRKMIT